MAHGSKRWIKDYRGRMKRSRHRTKQDFLADIPFVKSQTRRWRWRARDAEKPNCPQCRYLQKQFQHDNDWYWEQHDAQLAEFKRRYARWLVPNWPTEAHIKRNGELVQVVSFWRWQQKHYPNFGHQWTYHWNTMLCFKCEQRSNTEEKQWRRYPGVKKNLGGEVRAARRKYRAQVRNAMQRCEYEDILPPRRCWLD